MPAASRHDVIQFGSQALDKIANGPAFPDVFLKVDHTKSILRFDIRFMAGPFRKEGAGHGPIHSGGTNRKPFSDDTTPTGGDRVKRSFKVQTRRYLGPRPALAE